MVPYNPDFENQEVRTTTHTKDDVYYESERVGFSKQPTNRQYNNQSINQPTNRSKLHNNKMQTQARVIG